MGGDGGRNPNWNVVREGFGLMQPTTPAAVWDVALFCMFEKIDPSEIDVLHVGGRVYFGESFFPGSLDIIRSEMAIQSQKMAS